MDLSSLNVDVLLYLMKFLDPAVRFNVVLSGVLKGFENANEGIDLRKRIKDFGIELGLSHDGMHQLEIRSLQDRCSLYEREHGSHLNTLERLAEGGYFKNNRQVIVTNCCPPSSISRLFRVLRFMTDLETLSLLEWKLILTQDVPQLFRSCPSKF